MERKLVFYFLDEILGRGFTCRRRIDFLREKVYIIHSNTDYIILVFILSDDNISIIIGDKLSDIVMGFFPIDKKTSLNYIRDWFGERYGMDKKNDIRRFIPPDGENLLVVE